MWLFLYSEIMLFGALFILYAAYFLKYQSGFAAGGSELDLTLGTANTLILLTSSFAVASSLAAVQKGSMKLSGAFLLSAIVLGMVFLGIKYFEWSHKISAGIYPGSAAFKAADPAGHGRIIFYNLYFTMTGIHAVHVTIGLIVLMITFAFTASGRISRDNHALLENAGLYWHLVDILWIFIFPMLYLIA